MLLTVADLAIRWGVSSAEAIRLVQREHVPFVPLRTPGIYVRWANVRFKIDDVERWEALQTRTFRGQPSEQPTAKSHADPAAPRKRLGRW